MRQQQDYGFGVRQSKPGEIDFWAKFFGVDGVTILYAVDKVGTEALRVRQYLEQNPFLH